MGSDLTIFSGPGNKANGDDFLLECSLLLLLHSCLLLTVGINQYPHWLAVILPPVLCSTILIKQGYLSGSWWFMLADSLSSFEIQSLFFLIKPYMSSAELCWNLIFITGLAARIRDAIAPGLGDRGTWYLAEERTLQYLSELQKCCLLLWGWGPSTRALRVRRDLRNQILENIHPDVLDSVFKVLCFPNQGLDPINDLSWLVCEHHFGFAILSDSEFAPQLCLLFHCMR